MMAKGCKGERSALVSCSDPRVAEIKKAIKALAKSEGKTFNELASFFLEQGVIHHKR